MKVFGSTHQGMVRSNNQDTFRTELRQEEQFALLTVCDGMGGANAGNVASSMAAEVFSDEINRLLEEGVRDTAAVRIAVSQANDKVFEQSLSDPHFEGMGTTLVAALIRQQRAVLVNVGDSRAYRIRGGEITQLTVDHSYVMELFRQGKLTAEEVRTHPNRNLITRAVGVDHTVEADVFEGELAPTDFLLLCSDGLTGMLDDQEIAQVISNAETPADAVNRLIEFACERGGTDNITVVLFTGAGILEQGEAENG